MMMVKLDWPATSLWPNRSHGKHWAASSTDIAQARYSAKIATLQATYGRTMYECANYEITLEFRPSTARRYDLQNAFSAMKGALDGIADALGVDDSTFHPVRLVRGDVCTPGCVVVRIEMGAPIGQVQAEASYTGI